MKRILSACGVTFVLALAFNAMALDSQKFKVPSDANYNKVSDPAVYGLSVSSRNSAGTALPNIKNTNTALKVWASARGIFFDAWMSSGTANAYCVFFDSAAPKAITSWDDPEIVLLGVGFRGTTTATWESAGPGDSTAAVQRGAPLAREFRNGLASICTDDNGYFPIFRKADD